VPAPLTSQNLAHYDPLLTNVALVYAQDAAGFVADKVFPPVEVSLASGTYWSFGKGNFFRDEVQVRPMGGRSPLVTYSATRLTYQVEEESLATFLDERERANASPGNDPEAAKIRLITNQQLIHRDKKWANAYFKSGVWSADIPGHATLEDATHTVFWNLSTSVPITTVRKRRRAIMQATGKAPNVLVIGSDVEMALLDNAQILARINGGTTPQDPAMIDDALLSRVFGIRVVTATAINNTADEGQTDTMAFIVDSKSALLAYATPSPSIEEPSAGYIFAWNGLLGSDAFSPTTPVLSWHDTPSHSDFYEVRMAYTPKIVASDLGVFFPAVVQ
jgi:hypothetical protein